MCFENYFKCEGTKEKDKKPDKRLAEPCAKIDLKGLPVPLGDVSEMKMLAAPDLLNQKS